MDLPSLEIHFFFDTHNFLQKQLREYIYDTRVNSLFMFASPEL